MTVIDRTNFNEKLPQIEKSIKEAKFIGIDLEFSALHPLKTPSLFDNPRERYTKLRTNLLHIIPIQMGVTTFNFDPTTNSYQATIYTFYVLPVSFPTVQRSFYFQSDTINFLNIYQFDFNKLFYLGIPFINRQQEIELRERLRNDSITENQVSCKAEFENICKELHKVIQAWYCEAKEGDNHALTGVYAKYKNNYELLYFIHKYFRTCFKCLWTSVENNEFHIKRVTEKEYEMLKKSNDLEEELINNLLGITKIFRLITSLGKPIIGHNLLQDILLLITNFETPLPHSYSEFKKLAHQLFPLIFDTKTISYELRNIIPEEKCWTDTSLGTLFEYFKNGTGRHLVLNSPAVTLEQESNYGKFHEAGWDSFCAGYIFIRLAYLNIYHKFPKSKTFMSNELIGGLSHLKNYVNVIRGAVSHIKLDGEDPSSKRPPFLVIESIKDKSVDISQISSILGSFGFVELRKLPHQNNRCLIAVDNFTSARRILNNFKSHNEFQVKQYNAIKHSPVLRAFILSGITVSGAVLLWLTHRCCKT